MAFIMHHIEVGHCAVALQRTETKMGSHAVLLLDIVLLGVVDS